MYLIIISLACPYALLQGLRLQGAAAAARHPGTLRVAYRTPDHMRFSFRYIHVPLARLVYWLITI